MDTPTPTCLDCGRSGLRHNARGLCGACYARRWEHGGDFADRPPLGPPGKGVDNLASAPDWRAYCDRQDAALRAEIRARRAAGRSLVLADTPAPPYRETWLPSAPVATD